MSEENIPDEWTYKPEAVIHAEVLTDQFSVEELHQFSVDNPMPRWLFHPEMPPYPSIDQFHFYWDRGNTFVVAVDQDMMLWGYRINSRKDQTGLWLHIRRERHTLHEPLGDNPHGGLTANARQSVPHLSALSWALAGGVAPLHIPGDGHNPNVAQIDHAWLRNRGIELYNEIYGPQYGLV